MKRIFIFTAVALCATIGATAQKVVEKETLVSQKNVEKDPLVSRPSSLV